MEYYVFQTEDSANQCLSYINGSGWFPITGNRGGKPSPSTQKTTSWATEVQESASGEWAVPRIPTSKLDLIGVPQADRDAFLAAFGQDIRTLTPDDFPPEEV